MVEVKSMQKHSDWRCVFVGSEITQSRVRLRRKLRFFESFFDDGRESLGDRGEDPFLFIAAVIDYRRPPS